jgi:hypothetical protein
MRDVAHAGASDAISQAAAKAVRRVLVILLPKRFGPAPSLANGVPTGR